MTLTSSDLQTLCQLAIETATSTGQYIAGVRPQKIEHKNNNGSLATQVVTETDHESQRRILAALAPTFEHYDLALLTEESPDDGSRLEKDHFWCIDPIDGTLCFIEGVPGYAVSIALVSRGGISLIGVVYDPVAKTVYHAIRGRGAFRNAGRWQPDLKPGQKRPRVFTDQSEAQQPSFARTVRALGASVGPYGGGVMNALRCLESAPACYFKFSKPNPGGGCFWDFAATACIYGEVGAWASDAAGRAFEFNRAESVYLNHCGVLYSSDEVLAKRFLSLDVDRL